MKANTENNHLTLAKKYYKEMLDKNFEAMASCLHKDVHLISPLSEIKGNASVVEAAKNLSQILGDINIRTALSDENEIMLAYDFFFPEPIGVLRAAVRMDFQEDLIKTIELFYDGRPFEDKQQKIFKK